MNVFRGILESVCALVSVKALEGGIKSHLVIPIISIFCRVENIVREK